MLESTAVGDLRAEYGRFVHDRQDGIRRALIAGFGPELGLEACEDALLYGWRHWARIRGLENPAGYLYRVGHRIAQKQARRRPPPVFPAAPASDNPGVEPKLPGALGRLSRRQREAVVLVHAYGMSQREVSRLLGISKGSVQRHLDRGLQRLRLELGVSLHA